MCDDFVSFALQFAAAIPISVNLAPQQTDMILSTLYKLVVHNHATVITSALLVLALFSISHAAAREPDPLFRSDELLSFTLTGPINKIDKERDPAGVYGTASLSYTDSKGEAISLNVRLAPRGNKRLSRLTCTFPPLRILFEKKETANTIFAKQRKIKLVTQCNPESKNYEYYLLTEYLAYKTLNLLTDNSYKVRLARITYVDADSTEIKNGEGKTLHTSFAFFIEPGKRLAKRIGKKRLNIPETSATRLDGNHLNLVSLFQMMIGNTDWSATHVADGECCHNGKLFGEADSLDNLFIPYDFDITGLVNPEYAEVDKAMKLDGVRERRYRGYCRNLERLDGNLALLNLKQPEIIALFEHAPYLPGKRNRMNRNYVEKFFRLVNNPKRVKRKIYGRCHKSYMTDKES